jgi:hypothetical protein
LQHTDFETMERLIKNALGLGKLKVSTTWSRKIVSIR